MLEVQKSRENVLEESSTFVHGLLKNSEIA